MRFPICNVCLKSEILCSACSERISELGISKEEIEMYRKLYKALKGEKTLKDLEIKRIVGKNFIFIITKRGDAPKLIGKGGRIVKKIANVFKKPIRILEEPLDLRDFANNVFFTVPILGINIEYKPYEEIYKIRIPKSERAKLPLSSDTFANLSNSLLNLKVDVVFE